MRLRRDVGLLGLALLLAAAAAACSDDRDRTRSRGNPSATAPFQLASPTPGAQVRIVNGIRIGPGAASNIECRVGEPVDADPRWVVGTPLEIAPKYLPAGAVLRSINATECHSVNNAAGALYELPDAAGAAAAAGALTIGRAVGILSVPLALPVDAARPVTVAGRPAAYVPSSTGAPGRSALVIAEDWGVTILTSNALDEAELLRVGEGLY